MQDFPKKPNFREIEEKWIKLWMEEYKDVFEFDLSRGGELYIIDTPPPFTSGEAHMGHVLNWVWMDFVAKLRKLQGYNVYLPQGWDVHGLPTELKVEKKLGIPKDNIRLFLEKAREWTEKSKEAMKKTFIKIGYTPDWSKEYYTMDEKYRRLTQRTLIEMYNKGLLYRDRHPIFWCPNCETAIAAQEIGYIEKEGILTYLKLPLTDGSGYITIATTRPEMLPAAVAVFVHPEDKRYEKYIGKKVRVPLINREIPILSDPDVDPEFGTGVVWLCTYGDEQDIKWQKRYNLPVYEIIDEKGRLINTNVPEIEGLKVEEARKKILEILKKRGYIEKVEKIKHNVLAHTERSDCKAPIEFRVTWQWFIKIRDFKEKLKEIQKEIKFYPEHMRKRLLDWIDSVEWDWVISRQRVWGTPLPFWICKKNGEEIIIPARIEDLPVDPRLQKPPKELLEKYGCSEEDVEPVTDILDCWVESSITPLAILVYAGVPYEELDKYLPTALRPQGYEIIRTWLFYTLLRTYLLKGKLPWKETLINGMVLAPDGRKMSKSLGNVIKPEEVLEKYPADALRYWALFATPGDDYRFEWKEIEAGRGFVIKLWNISRFIWMNTKDKEIDLNRLPELKPIDIWILSKLKETIEESLDAFESERRFQEYMKAWRRFVWNYFADTYLELVKYRIYEENDYSALWTLLKVLRTILIYLSPAIPFTTEEIYNRIFAKSEGKRTIFENRLPEIEIYDKRISEQTDKLLEVISIIRKYKSERGLKFKDEVELIELPKEFEELKFLEDLKRTFNIKEIRFI